VAWPAVAGIAAGGGLLAAYVTVGPLPFAIALAVLELTIAPLAWTVMVELGHDPRGVVRTAPLVALGAVAMIGFAETLHSWCFVASGLVLVTSPVMRGWHGGHGGSSLVERVAPRADVRRRFDEIVAGFGTTDDDFPTADPA
jgi:hypothetical protein